MSVVVKNRELFLFGRYTNQDEMNVLILHGC